MSVVRMAVTLAAVMPLVAGIAGCGGNDTAADTKVLLGFASAVKGDPTHDAIRDVIEGLAKKRGWDVLTLNNNVDGPTALQNADVFVSKDVDYVIEFQIDATVMPKINSKFAAAGIPWISFEIDADGSYWLGADNAQSGELSGQRLGQFAKAKWDCKPDLVLLLEAPELGAVSDNRVGKAQDGLLSVCPQIDSSVFVTRSGGGGDQSQAQQVARDVLISKPNAKRVLVTGLNDKAVTDALNAAEQLGRGAEVWGWGNDGSLLTGKSPNPHLLGSNLYFLEGYGVYAMRILDQLAVGKTPPKGSTGVSPDAILVDTCPVTAEQAKSIPPQTTWAQKILDASPGSTAFDVLCPAK